MAEGGLWVKEQDVGSKKFLKHQSKETSNFACIPCVLTKNTVCCTFGFDLKKGCFSQKSPLK